MSLGMRSTVPKSSPYFKTPSGQLVAGGTGVYTSPMSGGMDDEIDLTPYSTTGTPLGKVTRPVEPRLPQYGTGRGGVRNTGATAPTPAGGGFNQAGIALTPYALNGVPITPTRNPIEQAYDFLAALDSAPKPSGGTGGGLTDQQRTALQAIATLRGQLNAPSRYDALGAQLADIYGQAEERIRQAGSELGSALSAPVAQRQFTPAMTVAPAAMTNYLAAIGASGADVAAQQQLSNALLQQIASGAEQYGQGVTQANEIVRQAMAGAVPANQLAGISQASLNRAALEAQMAAAKAQERKALEDQILELALKYGVGL